MHFWNIVKCFLNTIVRKIDFLELRSIKQRNIIRFGWLLLRANKKLVDNFQRQRLLFQTTPTRNHYQKSIQEKSCENAGA